MPARGRAWLPCSPVADIRSRVGQHGVMAQSELAVLLADLRPVARPGTYVFALAPEGIDDFGEDAVVTVREPEGRTVVLSRAAADRRGLPFAFEAAWITLTVNSALDAVGLTAAVATALTARGISCNVVAGYHHDHLFVPADRLGDALDALGRLARG